MRRSVISRSTVSPVGRLCGRPVLRDHLPARRRAPVVEHRLAHRLDLDRALDALDHAHQHVIGVVVGRRPRVRRLVGVVVVPRPDRQPVVDDDPPRRGHPRRLEDHRPRHVAHRQRHDHPVRPDPERARAPVQQRPEHARRVEPRDAHPLDAAVGRDQRARVAVRQEPVVGDRRERRAAAERRVVRRDRDARAHGAGGAYPSRPGRTAPGVSNAALGRSPAPPTTPGPAQHGNRPVPPGPCRFTHVGHARRGTVPPARIECRVMQVIRSLGGHRTRRGRPLLPRCPPFRGAARATNRAPAPRATATAPPPTAPPPTAPPPTAPPPTAPPPPRHPPPHGAR